MRGSVLNLVVASLLLFVVIRTAMRLSNHQMGDSRYRTMVSDLLLETRADVDRAGWHLQEWFPEEAQRFRRVRKSIANFHFKLEGGRFDEPAMDNVLNNLRDFVARNRLRPQERDALTKDLDRLLKPKEQPKPQATPQAPPPKP